jgi:hypothetical protein
MAAIEFMERKKNWPFSKLVDQRIHINPQNRLA